MVKQKKLNSSKGHRESRAPLSASLELYCDLFYLVMYTNPWVLK